MMLYCFVVVLCRFSLIKREKKQKQNGTRIFFTSVNVNKHQKKIPVFFFPSVVKAWFCFVFSFLISVPLLCARKITSRGTYQERKQFSQRKAFILGLDTTLQRLLLLATTQFFSKTSFFFHSITTKKNYKERRGRGEGEERRTQKAKHRR